MAVYSRARPAWADFPSTSTLVRAADVDQWDLALYETKGRLVNPCESQWGAIGDGVVDDYVSLAAAITDAQSAGVPLWLPPGKTFLVGTTPTISQPLKVLGYGATIKKKSTLASHGLLVTGNNVSVYGLTVDGNQAAGATSNGIPVSGTNVKFVDVTSQNCKAGSGISVFNSGTLDCFNCVSSGHKTSSGTGGQGFYATLSGRLRTFQCRSESNQLHGFQFDSNAAAGCHLDGWATSCGGAAFNADGAQIASAKGTSSFFFVSDCKSYGLELDSTASDWNFSHIEIRDMGLTDANNSATAIELLGATNCTFGNIVATNTLGYGVALAQASSHNSFGTIHIYGAGDPAIHLSGGSQYNSFGTLRIRAATYAVIFGEGLTPASNDFNQIATIFAENCDYAALRIDAGSYNNIGRIISRNTFTTDATFNGLVDFSGVNTVGNIVGFLDHRATGTKPKYVVHADPNSSNNLVLDGITRGDYVTAAVSLAGTGNNTSPALAAAGSLR